MTYRHAIASSLFQGHGRCECHANAVEQVLLCKRSTVDSLENAVETLEGAKRYHDKHCRDNWNRYEKLMYQLLERMIQLHEHIGEYAKANRLRRVVNLYYPRAAAVSR